MDANAIHDICFCADHRYQHAAGKGCQAGKLSRMLDINMTLAAWLVSKYSTAEQGAEAVKYSTEEHTAKMLLRHEYITEAEYQERWDRALEMLYHQGGMSDGEYLKLAHPEPRYSYEELEAANWRPSELGF